VQPGTKTRDYDGNGGLRLRLSLFTAKYVIRRYCRATPENQMNFSDPKTAHVWYHIYYHDDRVSRCPHRVGRREIIIIIVRVIHGIRNAIIAAPVLCN